MAYLEIGGGLLIVASVAQMLLGSGAFALRFRGPDHGGDLNRVKNTVRLAGYVNSTPDFYGPSQVMNGASDLLVDVFGEADPHRSGLLISEVRIQCTEGRYEEPLPTGKRSIPVASAVPSRMTAQPPNIGGVMASSITTAPRIIAEIGTR